MALIGSITSPTISGNTNIDSGTLFVDSVGNKVGVGTSSPAYTLHGEVSDTTKPAGYFRNTSGASNSPALIARGGANNSGDARIISAQDYDGNEEFGISGTGELRVNAGFGSAGLAYGVRAWANFNASGTPAFRGSGNCSSITDNGTGQFYINFTNAMPDTNYACFAESESSVVYGGEDEVAFPNSTSRMNLELFVNWSAADNYITSIMAVR